jgi:hypothetical protein
MLGQLGQYREVKSESTLGIFTTICSGHLLVQTGRYISAGTKFRVSSEKVRLNFAGRMVDALPIEIAGESSSNLFILVNETKA